MKTMTLIDKLTVSYPGLISGMLALVLFLAVAYFVLRPMILRWKQTRLLWRALMTFKKLKEVHTKICALEYTTARGDWRIKVAGTQDILKAALKDGLIVGKDHKAFPINIYRHESMKDQGVTISKRVVDEVGFNQLTDYNIITVLESVVQTILVESKKDPIPLSCEELFTKRADGSIIDRNLTLYREIMEAVNRLLWQCPLSLRILDKDFWMSWETSKDAIRIFRD